MEGSTLPALMYQSHLSQALNMMGKGGCRDLKGPLNISDRQPVFSGPDQQSENFEPGKISQFSTPLCSCFYVHLSFQSEQYKCKKQWLSVTDLFTPFGLFLG